MEYTGWCQNDLNAQGYTCPPTVSGSRCACSLWKASRCDATMRAAPTASARFGLVRPSHGPQSHSDAT